MHMLCTRESTVAMCDQNVQENDLTGVAHLNYAGITDETAGTIAFEAAEYIYLKRNLLTKLPENIVCLSTLKELHAEANNIHELPEALSGLSSLTVLNLSGNQLSRLPASIGSLDQLRKLQLNNNDLTGLPKELSQLSNLQTLEAGRNKLSSLPVDLAQCQNLRTLALDKNHLRRYPRQLCYLRNLEYLSLADNQLACVTPLLFKKFPFRGPSLADELGQKYKQLRTISIDDNPLLRCLPTALCTTVHHKTSRLNQGEFHSTQPDKGSFIRLANKEEICIPQEFEQMCVAGRDSVQRLVELSLRAIYNCIHSEALKCADVEDFTQAHIVSDTIKQLPLPTTFIEHLRYPTAVCDRIKVTSGQPCKNVLFTAPHVLLARRPGDFLYNVWYFCSTKCLHTSRLEISEMGKWEWHDPGPIF